MDQNSQQQNSIYLNQNNLEILNLLSVQKNEYSKAKRNSLFISVIIFFLAILSFTAAVVNSELLNSLISLLAVFTLIINNSLNNKVESFRIRAAQVQKYIDVKLYTGVINNDVNEWGDILTATELAEICLHNPVKQNSSFVNWYADYSTLEPIDQIYYCQRENIRWNNIMHKKYKKFIDVCLGLIIIICIISSLVHNLSLISFINNSAHFLPVFVYIYELSDNLKETICTYDSINLKANEIERDWSGLEYSLKIRNLIELQNGIQTIRENCTMIPDWYYYIYRNKQEDVEVKISNSIQKLK